MPFSQLVIAWGWSWILLAIADMLSVVLDVVWTACWFISHHTEAKCSGSLLIWCLNPPPRGLWKLEGTYHLDECIQNIALTIQHTDNTSDSLLIRLLLNMYIAVQMFNTMFITYDTIKIFTIQFLLTNAIYTYHASITAHLQHFGQLADSIVVKRAIYCMSCHDFMSTCYWCIHTNGAKIRYIYGGLARTSAGWEALVSHQYAMSSIMTTSSSLLTRGMCRANKESDFRS